MPAIRKELAKPDSLKSESSFAEKVLHADNIVKSDSIFISATSSELNNPSLSLSIVLDKINEGWVKNDWSFDEIAWVANVKNRVEVFCKS